MPIPYVSLLKTAWKYAGTEKPVFLKVYAFFIITNLVVAVNPLLYGWFVDALQTGRGNGLKIALWYALGFMSIRLVEWLFHGPARVLERNLAFKIGQNFILDLYKTVLAKPMTWHQDNHSGYTINRIRKGYDSLKEFFQSGFVHMYALGKFVISLVAMLYFSPLFGSIAVLLGAFTIWVIFKFDKSFVATLKEVNEKEGQVSSALFDSLSNVVTVVTLRLENRMVKNLKEKIELVFPAFRKNITINEWKWFVAQMLVGLIYVVIVVGYVYQHYTPGKEFLIGGLVTLLVYVNQFTSVFNDVAYQYTRIIQFNTNVEMAKETIQDAEATILVESSKLPAQWNKIEISGLNFFRNNDASKPHGSLQDIHLNLQKGKRIALIGESGSGKSTLLSLLRGLQQAGNGAMLRTDGGEPIPFEAIHQTITLLPQEPEIFENTILHNINLGLTIREEEIIEACQNACFMEVLKNLPNGLETHIKEKGVNLSGGQKQRLALARGIVSAKTSDILLLDEPTSSVDPRTEMLIYNKLFALFKDKVIISSLHRLHLLPLFDYIYILDHGKIVDEGTFTDLQTKSALFKLHWQHQQVLENV